MITYAVPYSANVNVSIYDIHGRHIKTLASGMRTAGYHKIAWNAEGTNGQRVASGIYICKMHSGKFISQKKLILMK
jgi:flagellar hook assembly protein FlgD